MLGAGHFNDFSRLTAYDIHQQPGCSLHSVTGKLVIYPTLKPMRGVCMQAKVTGLARKRNRVEIGCLEYQITGLCTYTRVLATHNACDGYWLFMVGNHQRLLSKLEIGRASCRERV